MRPVTAPFLRAVRSSHAMVARATVCGTFQSGIAPTGTVIPILGGDVQLDGTADIRSTLDMTTDGAGMWPTNVSSLLAPYGNEIFVERGIAYSPTNVEYVSLGYFRIQAPEQDTPPSGPIRLSGRDRMAGIVDARLVSPRLFSSGASLGFIMNTLVQEVYASATIEWDDTTDTAVTTRPLIADEDRFKFLDDLVKSRGKIWYWDHRGVLVIRSLPTATNPVFDVTSGADGVLISMRRQLTRERVYNAVVASGEAFDNFPPTRAVAYDNNQQSATYYNGRFGPVPRFFTSPWIFSPAQAASAADTMLRRGLGLPYSVTLAAVPNPALEPWDPIRVRYSSGSPDETHILETVTVPLTADSPVTATTREQTTVLVGTA